MRLLKLACAVLLGATAFAAASLPGAFPAEAQSLQQLYNSTARGIAKTMRDAQAVIDSGKSKKRKSKTKQADSRTKPGQIIPPIPERKPRPWAKEEEQTVKVPTRSVATTANAKPAASMKKTAHAKRKTAKPARAKSPDQKTAGTGDNDEGKEQAKPAPDIYTDVQINIAKARCKHLLKKVDAVTIAQDPMKKGPCGNAAPVKLVSLGSKNKVSISPPALVNCDMVVALHDWLEQDLQPLAKKLLGAPIVKINNISSYSCRNAYGRKNTRLSEHARANALDIAGFVTAKSKTADLLKHWGPTERDIKAARLAKQKAKEEERKAKEQERRAKKAAQESPNKQKRVKVVAVKGGKKTALLLKKPLHDGLPDNASDDKAKKASKNKKSELSPAPARLGGAKPPPPGTARAGKQNATARLSSKPKPPSKTSLFLRAAHKRACRRFGTTLGPEANEAHRNHFHVDLAPRKYRNFCE